MVRKRIELVFRKPHQNWIFALLAIEPVGELGVHLDHTPNKELFLFRGVGFPVIWLDYRHQKSRIFCPLLMLPAFRGLWIPMHIILYGGQFVHLPCLAN